MEITHLPLPPPPKLNEVILLFCYSFICGKFGRLFYFIIYYSNNTFFFLHKIFIKSYEIRVYEQICTHLILSLYIFLLQTKYK